MHLMVYGELVQAPQTQLAQLLCSLLPKELDSVYFVNSGSEAVEGAMKLAKRFTGRTAFAAQTAAYHGSTQGALSLMDAEYFTAAFRPLLPEIYFINQNNIEEIDKLPKNLAAIFVELVQAEKGAMPCNQDYILALRKFCTDNKILLVFDEIQTGMGRTGSLFAFEQYQVIPDILLLGKAFGGGMPLGAFICNQSIMSVLAQAPVLGHITTFGGHPVSCAAAYQALNITAQSLDSFQIQQKNQLFYKLLNHPKIEKITGAGLLLGVHLKSEKQCKDLIQFCLANGVFTDFFLHASHVLRIAPPLTIAKAEIEMAVNVILRGLNET
jgi:acetylornithine/succinyldiaminopimelate/putrescine aminotransferase